MAGMIILPLLIPGRMISILIPIYNTSVTELVTALRQQCLSGQFPFEIICLDDCSSESYRRINASLNDLDGVEYAELSQNVGRSRIRNLLTDMARYPYLLFMDGDSRVIKTDYLSTYVDNLKPSELIYGGRVYQPEPPTDPIYQLHWHYGRQREAIAAAQRRQHSYRTFMTNNFVVPRDIATEVRFDESITRYGYEDTLYALELQHKGYRIHHLDNPLEHIGLESRPVFVRKVGEALDNLRELLPNHPEIDTRLLAVVRKLEDLGLTPLARSAGKVMLPALKQLILSFRQSPLWLLDLYKLLYFLK